MSILQKIRLVAAIVLVCAIFLPLSECSRGGTEPAHPPTKSLAQHLFPQNNDDYGYQYAISAVVAAFRNPKDNSLGGALTLVAFLWPLAVALLNRSPKRSRFWWIFYPGELLLCAGTAYTVYALAYGTSARWLYGGYLAEVAIVLFAGSTLILLISSARNFVAQRHALKISNLAA